MEPAPEPEPAPAQEPGPGPESLAATAGENRDERASKLAAEHQGAGITRDEMMQRTAAFVARTGAPEDAALEMLIPSRWNLDDALDLWEEQQKELRYQKDKLGLGVAAASLWSWGSKAAEAVSGAAEYATEAATEISKDVVNKAKEASTEVASSKALADIACKAKMVDITSAGSSLGT